MTLIWLKLFLTQPLIFQYFFTALFTRTTAFIHVSYANVITNVDSYFMFEKVIIQTLQRDWNINQDLESASYYGGLVYLGNFLSIKQLLQQQQKQNNASSSSKSSSKIKQHQHTQRYWYFSQLFFKQYFRNQM